MKKEHTAAVLRVLDRFPAPIVITNPETAEVLWVNASLLKLSGRWTREDLVGKSVLERIKPDQLEQVLGDLSRVASKKSVQSHTYHVTRSSGESLAAQVASTPMMFDGQLAMLSVLTDVTERERLLAELRESEERYRTLMETLPIAVVVVVDERFVYANAAMVKLVGAQDVKQVLGHSLFEFISEQEHKAVRAARKAVLLEGGAPVDRRMVMARLDGAEMDVMATITRVRWEGLLATQTVVRPC